MGEPKKVDIGKHRVGRGVRPVTGAGPKPGTTAVSEKNKSTPTGGEASNSGDNGSSGKPKK